MRNAFNPFVRPTAQRSATAPVRASGAAVRFFFYGYWFSHARA
jgi:hypothetical protein